MPLSEQETATTKPATRRGRFAKYLRPALAVLALLGGTAAIYAGSQGLGEPPTYQQAPTVAKPFAAADPNTYTGTEPPPEMPPSTIAIPALGITAPVAESDIDASGALVLPTSDRTTRYTGAASLGATEGSTVIAGHVNFADGSPGALEPLAKITKGTPVYVTDATGTRHEYKANTAETITKTGLPQELFAPVGPPQLVLITCGGLIDNTGSILEYTHNTVVTAAPAPTP